MGNAEWDIQICARDLENISDVKAIHTNPDPHLPRDRQSTQATQPLSTNLNASFRLPHSSEAVMTSLLATFWFGFLATVVLVSTGSAGEDDIPANLSEWLVTRPPLRNSPRWRAANQDTGHEWVVSIEDARVRVLSNSSKKEAVTPLPFKFGDDLDERTRKHWIKVSDGYIIGFSKGEFGGGLWWFADDGKERYQISKSKVRGIFQIDSETYVLDGLAHMSISYGNLHKLSKGDDQKWKMIHVLDLKQCPDAFNKNLDGSLTIATTEKLIVVKPEKAEIRVLVDKAFWEGLYPNSMVVHKDGIYIGMRHGVARIRHIRNNWTVDWLLPNKSFDEIQPEDEK